MTVYEANKLMYQNVRPITDRKCIVKAIKDYVESQRCRRYFMLLNHEQKYITMFVRTTCKGSMEHEIADIVMELGPLKDIVRNDNGALEFWVEYNGEICMFVLFNYTKGVVEV